MCLCLRVCVQMTLQPAVLTQRQCVSMQLGPRTHGAESEQKVLKRGIICIRLCLKSCFILEVGWNMPMHANKCMRANRCTFYLQVHSFFFLAAGPKESNSGVNFKL